MYIYDWVHLNSFVEQVMMLYLQKLLSGTGSCKSAVATKDSTQAQYEEVPCDLSDPHNEDFEIELQYMSVAIQNEALK